MAWEKNLQDASWRGVPFDVMNVRGRKDRALAEYEVPYVHGGVGDDLAWGIQRISMVAVFWGVDYEQRLEALLKALDEIGPGELIHPTRGKIRALVVSMEEPYTAEEPDYCAMPIEFIETGDPAPFFAGSSARQKTEAAKSAINKGRLVSISALTAGLRQLARNIRSVKEQMGVLDEFGTVMGGLRSGVTGVISAGLSVLSFPGSWVGDMRGILSALTGLGPAASSRLGGGLSGWLGLRSRVAPTTTTVTRKTPSGVVGDARKLAQDTEVRERALTLADAATDVLADEADDPAMTPAEIERVTNDSRSAIQLAIDSARQTYELEMHHDIVESLKDVAYQVQLSALAALVQRPPLVQRRAPFDGNLHLIAHAWYGDFSRAEELRRLNPAVTNPNFITAGRLLYAYSR